MASKLPRGIRQNSAEWLAQLVDCNTAHVWPIEDLHDHIDSLDCYCKPATSVTTEGRTLVTHRAFDNRHSAGKYRVEEV